jgi:hypothetical protein
VRIAWTHIAVALAIAFAALLFVRLHKAGGSALLTDGRATLASIGVDGFNPSRPTPR